MIKFLYETPWNLFKVRNASLFEAHQIQIQIKKTDFS